MTDIMLSILMLAGIALTAGGVFLLVKKRDAKRALLMIVAALVMFGNVAVWLIPTDVGTRVGDKLQPPQ